MMADSYICPTCDSEVIVGKSCRVCSKNSKPQKKKKKAQKNLVKKPWEQNKIYDGLDLPDDNFDYDDFVEREFGNSDQPPHKKVGVAWYWWLTALLVCVIWILTMF